MNYCFLLFALQRVDTVRKLLTDRSTSDVFIRAAVHKQLVRQTRAFAIVNNPSNNSVLVFIIVALLLAADFWNVKNISGRLLVGLRWWNETTEDGQSVWVFESADVSAVYCNSFV